MHLQVFIIEKYLCMTYFCGAWIVFMGRIIYGLNLIAFSKKKNIIIKQVCAGVFCYCESNFDGVILSKCVFIEN